MNKLLPGKFKGFTLIELLVVIGILAILLTIVLIAINPARQFNLSNDTKRRSEILSILNAVHQYAADPANKGVLPAEITTVVQEISTAGADLCGVLVPTYISALPVDPENTGTTAPVTNCTAAYTSGYYIVQDTAGRVSVYANNTSPATVPTISITR